VPYTWNLSFSTSVTTCGLLLHLLPGASWQIFSLFSSHCSAPLLAFCWHWRVLSRAICGTLSGADWIIASCSVDWGQETAVRCLPISGFATSTLGHCNKSPSFGSRALSDGALFSALRVLHECAFWPGRATPLSTHEKVRERTIVFVHYWQGLLLSVERVLSASGFHFHVWREERDCWIISRQKGLTPDIMKCKKVFVFSPSHSHCLLLFQVQKV
jgi:hypothetical protein